MSREMRFFSDVSTPEKLLAALKKQRSRFVDKGDYNAANLLERTILAVELREKIARLERSLEDMSEENRNLRMEKEACNRPEAVDATLELMVGLGAPARKRCKKQPITDTCVDSDSSSSRVEDGPLDGEREKEREGRLGGSPR